jgi:hypothetical protein
MAIWNVTQEIEKSHLTQVFSGGACNVRNSKGELLRNGERDAINNWLTNKGILFFDPQIHPDTHGEEYVFEKHSVLEVAARKAAKINLYEISPRTFGGISSLEIASDHFRFAEPMVLYFSDGSTNTDRIPDHSKLGHPLFVPYGLPKEDAAAKAHYMEMRKNANNMRKFLMHLASEMNDLTIRFSSRPHGQYELSPDQMHAAEIFEAVVRALSGEHIYINFPSGDDYRDAHGNPVFVCPENPRPAELRALLDQYVDEGNALRKRMAELIGVNVFVRVVYTQKSAILGLEEMLSLKKMLPSLQEGQSA